MEILAGNDIYMGTLTYQDDALPWVSIGDYDYRYADYRDVRLMFKRLRRHNKLGCDFRYMVVSEYGGDGGRPHFHFILSAPPFRENETKAEKIGRGLDWFWIILNEWRRNISDDPFNPIYKPLCKYVVDSRGHSTYDFHYCQEDLSSRGLSDVAFYVTKYILKQPGKFEKLRSYLKLNYPRDEYLYYWRMLRPGMWFSKGFGCPTHPDVIAHIKKGVRQAVNEHSPYPYYIQPDSGQTFPLSNYYKQRILSNDDVFNLYYGFNPNDIDIDQELADFYKVLRRWDKFNNKTSKLVANRDSTDFLDNLK